MPKYVEAECCYYCGEGPAGEFLVLCGKPCCEGCEEDSYYDGDDRDPAGGDDYDCDGCGETVPARLVSTVMAYGCEGDFCYACRNWDGR